MDHWIRRFKNAKTVAGEERVIIPGEPEKEMEAARMKNGIPLADTVVNDLQSLAKHFDILF
jgi:LDH2 family malate/lactate/ureidoglycolate dehydrogenase